LDEPTQQDSPQGPLSDEDLSSLSLPEYPAPVYAEGEAYSPGGVSYPALDDASSSEAATVEPEPPSGRFARLRRAAARLRPRRPALHRPKLRGRRLVAAIAGIALVVVLTGAAVLVGPRLAGSAGMSPSGTAGRSLSASAAVSPSLSASHSAAASASAGPIESGGPVPTPQAKMASVVFRDVVLDSATDPDRVARAFIFISDGPGVVSAQVVSSAPTDATTLCLTMDNATPVCVTGATPGFPRAVTQSAHSRWAVTLISANESSPIVDVAIGWPAAKPSVTVVSGRFQGAPNPDSLRSLTAEFRPRDAGEVTLDASWDPASAVATVTLTDATDGTVLGQERYPSATSVAPTYSNPVKPNRSYRLQLFNESADVPRTSLTATIAFP
jgi:hypothetical protein